MMTRLALTLAATALFCAPALAGYTIFEDEALPSVLFVEFDNVVPVSSGATRPTNRALSGPGVIGFDGTTTPATADGAATEGTPAAGAAPDTAATAAPAKEERDTFADTMDSALEIKNSDFRDFVVQEELRNEILRD